MEKEKEGKATHVFPELRIIGVFDFVKIVFVELPHEAGKVGVLEHPWEDRLCELVHVLHSRVSVRYGYGLVWGGVRTFTTKQSPWGPHETTGWKVWSSSILYGGQRG
jgi:hypothetical protein